MRLGLLGGSFDPIHVGHVALAERCRDDAGLDEVWLIPTAVQPLKPGGAAAGAADRLAMLRLAIEGRPGLVASSIEIDRGGTSYTVETLAAVRAQRPGADLFLLMGADTLNDLRAWRDPAGVVRLATPLVVRRAGEPAPDYGVLAGLADASRVDAIRRSEVRLPPIDVSSRELRRRLAAGEPCDGMLPPPVAAYIRERGLYR